jgi:hypothetical protein
VEGSCEHGIESSGSIKCWEVLERLNNWRLLKKGSAPWMNEWLFLRCAILDLRYLQCWWKWIFMCTRTCFDHSVVNAFSEDTSLSLQTSPGNIFICSESGGWTKISHLDQDFRLVFVIRFRIPLFLIMNNHSSHASVWSYKSCQSNGIIVVLIPSHTPHRMQPLDISYFEPLKSA